MEQHGSIEAWANALKLVQLRLECEARGLTTAGSKAELVVRLLAAIVTSSRAPRAAATDGKRAREPDDAADPVPRSIAAPSDDSDDSDAGPPVPLGGVVADEEEDADAGPAVTPSEVTTVARAKRRRVVPHERSYVDALPSAAMYEFSYMHRDVVTHVVCTPGGTDFIITASADGVIKFWKKIPKEIEFAKAYKAHLGAVVALAVSVDGLRLASIGDDAALKYYDVLNFDMMDIVKLSFQPAAAAWMYRRGAVRPMLAVSDRFSSSVSLFHGDRPSDPPLAVLSNLHAAPVLSLAFHERAGAAISIDAKGVIEYWNADPDAVTCATTGGGGDGSSGDVVPLGGPLPHGSHVFSPKFRFKSETDLFDIAKARACPLGIAVSPTGACFAVTATDGKVRVFGFSTGKLARVYDESVTMYSEALASATAAAAATVASLPGSDGGAPGAPSSSTSSAATVVTTGTVFGVPLVEFSKRLAAEKDLQASTLAALRAFTIKPAAAAGVASSSAAAKSQPPSGASAAAAATLSSPPPWCPPAFDDSGVFLLYSTILGIKIVNTVTNKVPLLLGKVESTERFCGVSLYQGAPKISSQFALARDAAAGRSAAIMSQGGAFDPSAGTAADPLLVTTAFRRNRFYLFSRREPADILAEGPSSGSAGGGGRDVFNEPPSKEDLASAVDASAAIARARLGSEAIIRTMKGDIWVKLMPDIAPRAVENFSTHARNSYFNGHIFHRVIKGFMVQTGDPTGTGTGGDSIWGEPFEDEINRSVRFDRPYTLAMANAGPCTNGSQWFLTTAPCSWLDGKHTIFGRVTRGTDVVKAIENVKTDAKHDKPIDDIKIISIDIR